MLKLHDNPPMKPQDSPRLADVPGRWYVAHTKARREKALVWALSAQGVPYFLPMTERLTCNRGRRFRSWLPLFSGYVFFAGDRQARQRALATRHLAGVLDVVDRDRFLAELSQIEQALDGGARLDPYPSMSHGSLCRVRCGPLAGLEGVVVRKNVTRLLLQVEMLGQAAALEIDGSLLEPAA